MGNVPLACERMNEFTLITSPFFFRFANDLLVLGNVRYGIYIYLHGKRVILKNKSAKMNCNFLQDFYFIFDESFRNI